MIGTSRRIADLPSDLSVTINGLQIDTTVCEKLPGVHVDQTLSWTHHIMDSMYKRSNRDLIFFAG